MSRFFKLEEFLTSSTARQKSIENMPSWEVVEHLKELAEFLDGLREDWGSGIRVSSGFRNDALNKAVGGVPNSCHRLGFAADIQPYNGKLKEFIEFTCDWLKDKDFDECIKERSNKTEWIHLQLYSPKGFQRKKIFSMEVK